MLILPLEFTIRLTYALNQFGLHQHISVHNEGQEAMPCLMAYHTTINAPFAPNIRHLIIRFQNDNRQPLGNE